MAQKKPFVLRIDPELLKAVEKWAADDHQGVKGSWAAKNEITPIRRGFGARQRMH
jgi:hypothetical protein